MGVGDVAIFFGPLGLKERGGGEEGLAEFTKIATGRKIACGNFPPSQ